MLLPQVLVLVCLQTVLAVQINTPLGKILGSTLTTRFGKTIYSFRGIRYAQAPINELRFQPPLPVEPWSGIYNATNDGPACPQPTDIDPVSEDCLLLNVYTTKLPEGGENPKRPVIIFLHPGSYNVGTGRSWWLGPQQLLDQDVVLVTINYRLGTLGFISLGIKEAPGNNGLKDQVMAMKWVKGNIAAFGGDPDSVTLYGHSAGAWSVSLHLVSKMSRGLFHKAIMSSGSTLGHLPIRKDQTEIAQKQARVVGCPDGSPKEILDCLKTKPAKELGDSRDHFSEFNYDPIVVWYGVIEEDYGQERFLTEHPVKLVSKGDFAKIPVITGITKDELVGGAFVLIKNATSLKELDDNFAKYAPICFNYERGTNKSKEVSGAVRNFYLGDGPLTNASLSGLTKIYADSIIGFPTYRGANLLSERSTKPVYYYEFTYQGRYSNFYLPGTSTPGGSDHGTPYGVVNHDDLMYLFDKSPYYHFNVTDPEFKMVQTLTSMWANFAKTGKPIPTSNPNFDLVEWEPYNTNTKKFLQIGEKLTLKDNLYADRYKFWDTLYPVSLYL